MIRSVQSFCLLSPDPAVVKIVRFIIKKIIFLYTSDKIYDTIGYIIMRAASARNKRGRKMSYDHRFYYDFDSEIRLDLWQVIEKREGTYTLRCASPLPVGDYIFLAPCRAEGAKAPRLVGLRVNGREVAIDKSLAKYVYSDMARYGFDLCFGDGENDIIADVCLPVGMELDVSSLGFSLQKSEPAPTPRPTERAIHKAVREVYERDLGAPDLTGWSAGIGHKVSSGRFGFSKGDGLLDSAMPSLGVVDKMFLSGQPKYQKPYRWSYSLLPEGMPHHGSFEPRDTGIDDDDISVNHLSVRWSAMHSGSRFSCTYSLASPAIITESDTGNMRLSGLRFAGNYQSVLIPREGGIETVSLDEADIRGMAENWILIYNSTEFPDVPIMLVFEKNPIAMHVLRDTGMRLSEILFDGVALMLSCTPFGIERFDVGAMPLDAAIRRCRFWSRALLAYPVDQKDYFLLDEQNERVRVRQTYEYRYISDEWGTEPLETAPMPPVLTISGVAELSDNIDFGFPTKYGHLSGRVGTWSEYTLPFMPLERKFPLRNADSRIPELLKDGMEEYKRLSAAFPPERVSYPYAGAIIEPFAFASTMMNFMDDEDREFIRKNLAERIPVALDPERVSDYTVVNWGELMTNQPMHDDVIKYYLSPERKHLAFRNWYRRIEPFTGAEFTICYLNVSLISSGAIKTGTPEEILGLKIPLIENDWGVGLTFYYLYLSALATGSFEEIRKRWDLIKSVYSFFELMHDWACMGTGYSDNGITWVEGANYGLFTSFVRMAEIAGDEDARRFGIYNAAKQMTLRLAVLRSSIDYFPKYFDVEPWYCTKHLHEEFCPSMAFQNQPLLQDNRCRVGAIYNFTTEGLYPEAYLALRRFGGEEYRETMCRAEKCAMSKLGRVNAWTKMQEYTALLMDKVLFTDVERAELDRMIEYGIDSDLLMREFRGIHIYSRVLPKNYMISQLYAWHEMRSQGIWLEHWEEMRIESATVSEGKARIVFVPSGMGRMKLVIGMTGNPRAARLNGEDIVLAERRGDSVEILPETGGVLEIEL